ncbi:hypothetical protein J2T56_000648 [Natronobacillus azotifigens]|uniref:DNRLRE domain-containing protein n=1 Tax=Natronobacillus azotifigens TaxID=472978 RepID=A0A9J6RAH0_9BACI|nr:hypothetical protein [Natronobacillus azotifigens]MCZ0702315.1 hypothetical protein [Natronobacillus azotifigens]
MRKLSVSVILIAIFAVLVSFTAVSAQESSEVKHDDESEVLENVGVSPELPAYVDEGEGEISPLGLGVPRNEWDMSIRGQYDFQGTAQRSTLYTDYLLTGQSSYSVRINNSRSDTFRVDLMQKNVIWDTTVRTWNVSPGASLFASQTGLSSSNSYYLKFHAPSNFSGRIR